MADLLANLKPLMTLREVAEALDISVKEARRLEHEGVLKPLRGYYNPHKFSGYQVSRWLDGEDQ